MRELLVFKNKIQLFIYSFPTNDIESGHIFFTPEDLKSCQFPLGGRWKLW